MRRILDCSCIGRAAIRDECRLQQSRPQVIDQRVRTAANADEVAELLGDAVDESIVDRIVDVGASIDEVQEAIDELEFQRRFGEVRNGSTRAVDEVRAILEEVPVVADEPPVAVLLEDDADEEHEGLRVIEADELTEQA